MEVVTSASATVHKPLCTPHTAARPYFPRKASDAYLQEEDAKSLLVLLLLLTCRQPLLRESVRLCVEKWCQLSFQPKRVPMALLGREQVPA